jgi:ABC-type oligopeptide transport system ATPase subunit
MTSTTAPLLAVRDLVKEFRRGPFGRSVGVRAVDRVSFSIVQGETLGLVGESGSGKTTIGRCVLRLTEPTSGEVRFRERDLLAMSGPELQRVRREMQIVFQDPWSSLNPRMAAGEIVAEPLAIHGWPRPARKERVAELLGLVGLDPSLAARLPHEFSGGQRQRIGLARALALEPAFLVADEPVTALDVSVQAQIVNLLMDLRDRLGLTCLLIAHDLRLVRHVCDRVAVLYRGRILESGPVGSVFDTPAHPYTRALLSAVPRPDPGAPRERVEWEATPDALQLELKEIAEGHWAAV